MRSRSAAHSDAVLQQFPLFQALTAEQRQETLARARERQIERRQMLFREGEPAHQVRLLWTGRVKVTQLSPAGAEVILSLNGPGDIVGELGQSPGRLHTCSAHALDNCRLLAWDIQAFEELSERIPQLRRNVMCLLSTRLRGIEERFRELATEQVAVRVARTLLRLLQLGGPEAGTGLCVALSREELAQMTGTTLFSVSRLLSDWKERGIVDARRQAVFIQQRAGLMELAGMLETGYAPV